MNPIHRTFAVFAAAVLAAPVATAQCTQTMEENWGGTPSTVAETFAGRSIHLQNPHPHDIKICGISVALGNGGCSSSTMHIEVRPDVMTPTPTILAMSASLPIPSSGFVTGTFSNLVIRANEPYQVVLDYHDTQVCGIFSVSHITRPAATSGTMVTSWELRRYGVNGALVMYDFADDYIRYQVHYEPHQRATSENYGASCGAQAPCATSPYRTLNWNGNNLVNQNFTGQRACRIVDPVGHPTRFLCGVDLRLRSSSPNAEPVEVAIYDESNSLPSQRLGSTIVMAPHDTTTVRASFPNPIQILAGRTYWLSVEPLVAPLNVPAELAGNPVTTAAYAGGMWQTIASYNWATRTYITTSTPQVPALDGEPPIIGQSFDTDLTGAPANTLAMLAIGWTNPNTDLSSIGAPGCFGLTSGELVVSTVTDANGDATVALPVPYAIAFLGMRFREQYAVLSPVNALGIAFTNGAKAKVGSF